MGRNPTASGASTSAAATARGAAGGRRFRVGIRLPEWAAGFGYRLFAGLTEFQRAGQRFELHFDQPSGGDLPPAPVDKNWRGDGLIVYRYTAEEARRWTRRGIKVVNLSAEIPHAGPIFPRVTMDNGLAGRQAAEHLAALGLRQFAYVHESARLYSEERLEGFAHGVRQVGGTLHVIDVPASTYAIANRPACIEAAMVRQMRDLPLPCGFFCKDDIAAVWTVIILQKLGWSCPAQAPVLGLDDDIVFCHTTNPPLSSIAYPGQEIGFAAARLLHRMMVGEPVPDGTRLRIRPGSVVARESTGQVILGDPSLAKAQAFIRLESPKRMVGVAEVAAQAGVSRELLRQKFHQYLGRSPKQEIDRLRMAALTDRLASTDGTLERIAEEMAFSGCDELCRFFRRMGGTTPGRFRKERRGGSRA